MTVGIQKYDRQRLQGTCCPACSFNKTVVLYKKYLRKSNEYDNFILSEILQTREESSNCILRFCKNCLLIYFEHRYSEGELNRLYSADYSRKRAPYISSFGKADNELERKGIIQLARLSRRNLILNEILKVRGWGRCETNILDIGGWGGENIPNISDKTNKYILDRSNHEVTCDGVLPYRWQEGGIRFDVVISTHVIEHVNYPVDFLIDASKHLAENGLIYLEVPVDIVGLFRQPTMYEHINFFCSYSLLRAIEAAGLACITLNTRRYLYSYHDTIAYIVVAEKKIAGKKYWLHSLGRFRCLIRDIVNYVKAKLDSSTKIKYVPFSAYLLNL